MNFGNKLSADFLLVEYLSNYKFFTKASDKRKWSLSCHNFSIFIIFIYISATELETTQQFGTRSGPASVQAEHCPQANTQWGIYKRPCCHHHSNCHHIPVANSDGFVIGNSSCVAVAVMKLLVLWRHSDGCIRRRWKLFKQWCFNGNNSCSDRIEAVLSALELFWRTQLLFCRCWSCSDGVRGVLMQGVGSCFGWVSCCGVDSKVIS